VWNSTCTPETYLRRRADQKKRKLVKFPEQLVAYDGCTAAAYTAYAWSEQAFIYPITPATAMGDVVAGWAGRGRKNMFGEICEVTQMQSEGGAAGSVHGVLEVGSLATTFTSSQGLLLMIPNMYLIAGALNPCVFHVAARAISKHSLCIFGDHTDVMATRQTGFAQLCGNNVQESMDMGLISHVSTLNSSVPFMNFFDGFRTSHEIGKINVVTYDAMQQLIPWDALQEFRERGLNPNRPHSRGLGQFGDTFFQNAELQNRYFSMVPQITQDAMDDVKVVTGREYKIFQYEGHPEAEHVVVAMGSGARVMEELLNHDLYKGKKVGLIKVRLFRPLDAEAFVKQIPKSCKRLAVLDRTKEQTQLGEPLYVDVLGSLQQTGVTGIETFGGRYGLGSKNFTPGMADAVFNNLNQDSPINSFSVGITDDVTFRSVEQTMEPDVCPPGTRQCVFWGMGSDGTVSANKNAIKLIGENTDQYVHAYFAYDSKKAGGCTISHLRFGPEPIDSPYEITNADFVSCSQPTWIHKFTGQMLRTIKPGGVFVLNNPAKDADDAEARIPAALLREVAQKDVKFYTIDANKVAREAKLGRHTNNVLTSVFFKLSEVLPFEEAETLLKNSMRAAYQAKGEDVVKRNFRGVDLAIENLISISYDKQKWLALEEKSDLDEGNRPAFATEFMDPLNALEGNDLPVSAFEARGHYPNATTQWEKRGIALTVPVTDMDKCTHCNKCAAICPHAAIRPFLVSQLEVDKAPEAFEMAKAKGGAETAGYMYRIQVAPEDCTGCEACSFACGDGALTMTPLNDVIKEEKDNWSFAIGLPNRGERVNKFSLKGSQYMQPLLEFSGACEGCGETPYAKLATQLFGERMVIANASGCSSVWAGTGAFSPLGIVTDGSAKGQGPAWGRSLFEDAGEYGFGMARALKQRRNRLASRVEELLLDEDYQELLSPRLHESLVEWLEKKEDPEIAQELSKTIPALATEKELQEIPLLREIMSSKDSFVKTSTWVWGGDGWAYDIGFGGLDHVLAGGTDINILVMDTEGYSNTGGQVSKATNLGSVQKFAPEGYRRAKKDLGALAMAYEDVYVASLAIGANYGQSVKAMMEAEAYPGTSLLLAYSPCIEHKILFPRGLSRLAEEMQKAVESGYWSLYRYNPALINVGGNPFTLDSKRLAIAMEDFTQLENRFMTLGRSQPEVAAMLKQELQDWANVRHAGMKWREERRSGESSGTPLALLIGSDTGTAIELAARARRNLESRNYEVTAMELDEVDLSSLAEFKTAMVLCSTAGEGDMPGNSTGFWEAVNAPDIDPGCLQGLQFSCFGLGDRGYKHFNQAAKDVAKRMVELGAVQTQDVGMGDDQDPDKYETAWEEWYPDWVKINNAPAAKDEHLIPEPLFELEEMPAGSYDYQTVKPPGTTRMMMNLNSRITPRDYDRDIRHLQFDLGDTKFSYLLGDALAIYPHNNPELVESFLEFYKLDGDALFQVSATGEVDKRRQASYRRPLTTRQIFTEVVDLFGRPTKSFYKELAKFAVDPAEKAEIDMLISDTDEGKAIYLTMVEETYTFADVLRKFRSAKVPMEHILTLVPCIKPRLYTIASSQRWHNNMVELMIVINDWTTPSGKFQVGTSTDYIHRLEHDGDKPYEIWCGLTSGSFNFPVDRTTPMVMTGLGTGLAPFRAFAQEWEFWNTQGQKTGNMWLFYGCRHKAKDYCFADELEDWEKRGLITHLRPAFSRDQKEKIYVQTRMNEVPEDLYGELVTKKGYFYLCGQAGQLEVDVQNAIKKAIKHGGGTDEEVEAEFAKMVDEGRYNLELY
jgi:homodimeric pyruvate:ferredoxin (flavodoxin) oxidoreductase